MKMIVALRAAAPEWFRNPFKAAIATGTLAFLVLTAIPNYFKAEARVLPTQSEMSSGLGGLVAAAAAFGANIPTGQGIDASYPDILKSRWLEERLLGQSFEFPMKSWRFGSSTPRKMTLMEYLDASNVDKGVKALDDIYVVSTDVKTNLLTLSVETRSPELSQQVVRRAVELLEEFVLSHNQTRGGNKAAFAEARLAEIKSSYTEAEKHLRQFLEVNRNFESSTDPAVRLQGERLEGELTLQKQLVSTVSMAREQALMDQKDDTPLLNVLDQGGLPVEHSKPKRGLLTLLAILFGGGASWAWSRRKQFLSNVLLPQAGE